MKIKIGEKGLTIPKQYFPGIDEVDVRKRNGVIVVSPVRGGGSIFNLGKDPLDLDIEDASVNHDKYIY